MVFQEAFRHDELCAMCLWGLAHGFGPTLNAPVKSAAEMGSGLAAARQALRLLNSHELNYTAKEEVLIQSMVSRYPDPPSGNITVQMASNRKYASLLGKLRQEESLQPDADLKVFQAEALMILLCTPDEWHFYESRGDSAPAVARPETLESTKLLQEALIATNQTHAYAQHMLIHSTEMSNNDVHAALPAAHDLLANTAKLQDQHLQHMTSHTYLRAGYYHKALMSNIVAVGTDSTYFKNDWMPYGPGHNSAFLVACALWAGDRAAAYKYVKVVQQVFERVPDQADFPDGSMAWNYPMMVALRFGDFDLVEGLEKAIPAGFASKWIYGGHLLMHYSRAVAEAHLGRLDPAREHLTQLRLLMPTIVAQNTQYGNLSKIANDTASAVLAMAEGQTETALNALAHAVEVEMAMPYSLPPNWLLPTRECYGHALLVAGRAPEAEKVFRAALHGQSFHAEPHCGWALQGLRRSLQAQGGHDDEIKALRREIQAVWKWSDVPLRTPCAQMDIGPMKSLIGHYFAALVEFWLRECPALRSRRVLARQHVDVAEQSNQLKPVDSKDDEDATYVVMWHEGWGKVKGETFDDFELACKRFEAFEGGRFAATLVGHRFRELRYYGTRGRWMQFTGLALELL
ncbi:unnamed protein product [Symbiodinium microadriaticum]|nr:unnamed protein product [Symbiodinium microadriaticum]